jgi:hypothetical protein
MVVPRIVGVLISLKQMMNAVRRGIDKEREKQSSNAQAKIPRHRERVFIGFHSTVC